MSRASQDPVGATCLVLVELAIYALVFAIAYWAGLGWWAIIVLPSLLGAHAVFKRAVAFVQADTQ